METGFKMNVGFLVLCHGDTDQIIRLLEMSYFNHPSNKVYLHYDKKSKPDDKSRLKNYCLDNQNIQIVLNPESCYWGDYSLVSATKKMIDAHKNDANFHADYLYLISGSCVPIKQFSELQRFLSLHNGKQFIQAVNVNYKTWVKGGLNRERYEYSFPFNFITQREQFETHLAEQKNKGIKRKKPSQIKDIHFGSQWFCITSEKANEISTLLEIEEIEDFFKQSWIPDEFAIQTLVAQSTNNEYITNANLTHYQFREDGKPIVLYNDHKEYLLRQVYFFARKASTHAHELYQILDSKHSTPSEAIPSLENFGINNKSLEIHKALYQNSNQGGKICRVNNEWNGGIDKNHKKYWVLVGHCKYYIKEIIKNLRLIAPNQASFGFVFNDRQIENFTEKQYFGITSTDLIYRNYRPIDFLYQMIHSTDEDVLIALDYHDNEHVREVIRWDKNAQIIILEPNTKSYLEKHINTLLPKQALEFSTLKTANLKACLNQDVDHKALNYWHEKIGDAKAQISYIADWENEPLIINIKKIVQRMKKPNYLPITNTKLMLMLNSQK